MDSTSPQPYDFSEVAGAEETTQRLRFAGHLWDEVIVPSALSTANLDNGKDPDNPDSKEDADIREKLMSFLDREKHEYLVTVATALVINGAPQPYTQHHTFNHAAP